MKVKAENIKEKDFPNYKWKQVTFVPEKGKLMSYTQIKDDCEDFQKRLPKGSQMTVTGLNILRNTTLYSSFKGFNKFKTTEEYDDYLRTFSVEDAEKFDAFYNFTITVRKDTTEDNPNIYAEDEDDDDEFA